MGHCPLPVYPQQLRREARPHHHLQKFLGDSAIVGCRGQGRGGQVCGHKDGTVSTPVSWSTRLESVEDGAMPRRRLGVADSVSPPRRRPVRAVDRDAEELH